METFGGAARKWAALQKLERGKRMAMIRKPVRKTIGQRIKHFFLKFNMCRCTEPKYEVLNGILCCHICRKPTVWEGQPK